MIGLVAAFGLEQVELAGFGFNNFNNLSESVVVFGGAAQAYGVGVAQYGVFDIKMHITKAAVGVAAPHQGVAGINIEGVLALTPSCEFHANIVDGGAAFELEGDPGG